MFFLSFGAKQSHLMICLKIIVIGLVAQLE